MTVCFTNPVDGATATGDVPVTVTASVNGTSPGVQKMLFYLDGTYLLTDFQAPYTFTLPSNKFVDGTKTLEADVFMRDGFVVQPGDGAAISLAFNNGNSSPPGNNGSFTPKTIANGPVTVAAVGDGAGGETNETSVSNLIASWNPNLFFYLGDVYERGTSTEFYNWYRGANFYGRFDNITDPTVGNHEYLSDPSASGYFDYWNNAPAYYSFNAGSWHIISLDANISRSVGSPQYQWLFNDLNANTQPCTLAFWHQPILNIGQEGGDLGSPGAMDTWALLAQKGVDMVVNGHDHTYQRYVPVDGNLNPSSSGITEFIAGTGGHAQGSFVTSDSRLAASATGFGALKLVLNSAGAYYEYDNTAGTTIDSGTLTCRSLTDTTQPTPPTNLSATAASKSEIDLSWGAATDNVGVVGYDVYRDGVRIAQLGNVLSYSDTTVAPATTYTYRVYARDAAGNVSGSSNPASATTPATSFLFSDGFESGDFSKWTSTSSSGMALEQTDRFSGAWAAEATAVSGSAAYASKTLAASQTDLYYLFHFKVLSQSTTVTLARVKMAGSSGTSGGLVSLFVNNATSPKIGYKNEVSGVSTTSTTASAARNAWHTAELHVQINGASSLVEVWLDGTKVNDLSRTESLGTTAIGRIELGDNTTNARSFDVRFDDVGVDSAFISDTTAPTAPANLGATTISGSEIDLSWTPSSDNVGVVGYDIFRNGALLASVGNVTTYADTTVAAHSSYTYQVRARDAAGNISPFSNAASASTTSIFQDDFETGDLSKWTTSTGLTVQQLEVFSGTFAARATTGGTSAYASKTLSAGLNELYYRLRFKILSQGANSVNLLRLRTGASASVLTMLVTSAGKLAYRDDVTGVTSLSTTTVSPLTWHELQVHVLANDPSSQVGVWLDGTQIAALTKGDTLGTTPIQKVEVGDSSGDAFDAVFDDVLVDAQFIPDTTPPTAPTGLTANATGGGIDLAWNASTDNLAVSRYTIFRDGLSIATVGGSTTTYHDASVTPGTTYTYTVSASDAAGNTSAQSAPASATAVSSVDTTPPTAPTNVVATAASGFRVDLTWTAATDNVGVTGYTVSRDGTQIATVGSTTSYSDTTVRPSSSYSYTVTAVDAAGNTSPASAPASVTTPHEVVFSDDFETGDLSRWSSSSGLVVQQQEAFSGSWAARATSSTGSPSATYARATLSPDEPKLDYRLRFKIASQGANSINLLRFRNASNGSILTALVTSTDKLAYRNDVAGSTATSTTSVTTGAWHELQVHVLVNGTASDIEVYLDGTKIDALSGPASLGSAAIARIDLGDSGNTTGTYDVFYDDVLADTQFIADTTPPSAPTGLTATAAGANEVDLSWTAATDNQAVTGYYVYRDGTLLATLGNVTSYGDTTVSATTTYSYTVKAFDASGNVSDASAPATVTTGSSDTTPPTKPTGLTATPFSGTQVDLSWFASTDDVGVTGYVIYRNGTRLTGIGAVTTYSDTSVVPSTSYSYSVVAVDAAGNASSASDPALATTPSASLLNDDFETGDLSKWTSVNGLVVQQAEVYGGSWAARATSTGSPAYAYAQLASSYSDLYYRVRFKILSQGANTVTLLRFRTASNGPLASVFVGSSGNVGYKNDLANTTTTGTTRATLGTWRELQAHVLLNGSTSHIDVWLDGNLILSSASESLGTTGVGRVELGDSASGRTYDVAFDDVLLNTSFIPDTTPPAAPTGLTATAPNPNRVDLSWTAATDNIGVTGYQIFRDGNQIASIGATATTYSDTTVAPSTSYTYTVKAVDAAGNVSAPSNGASVTTNVDTTPPSTPLALQAVAAGPTQVDLSWNASTDDYGVRGYSVYRNGVKIADVDAPATIYSDTTALPSTDYTYTVDAFDLAGNRSPQSLPAAVTTPHMVVASDDFESGDLSKWANNGLTVQQQEVFSGSWAARATTSGTAISASTPLAVALTNVYARVRFKLLSQGANSVYLLRLQTAGGTNVVTALVTSTDKLAFRYDGSATINSSITGSVALNAWHELQVHAVVAGASSQVEAWLDGNKIDDLTATTSLGTTAIGRLQLGPGAGTSGQAFDAALDDVLADSAFIPDTTPPTPPTLQATANPDVTVTLSWQGASDNLAVTGYQIYRDGTRIASVDGSTTSYIDSAVQPATTYGYTVKAVDAAGNTSVASNTATVTTATTDTSPPTPPGLPSATAISPTEVDVSWSASTDNVGVTGYTVYRDGVKLADLGPSTLAYADTTALPSTTYSYTVVAFDAVGNRSAASNPASATTPHMVLQSDDFESGSIATNWANNGLTAQQQEVYLGSWAARATSSGSPIFASKVLPLAVYQLYYRLRFKILSQGANSIYLLRLRSATGTALFTALVTNTGKLSYRNELGSNPQSTTVVTTGVWHELQAHVFMNGSSSQVDFWLDGTKITDLSGTATLGTLPVGKIELGSSASSQTFDVAYDDVLVDTQFIPDTTPPSAPTGLTGLGAANEVDLNWTAATDNQSIGGYEIYRDGALLATVGNVTTYADKTVAPNVTYTYAVRAFDTSGNYGPMSASIQVLADGTAPTAPTNLAAVTNGTEADLSWGASSDNVGVTGYSVFRNGVKLADLGAASTTYVDTTVVQGSTYTYTVKAFDAAGNVSAPSNSATLTIPDVTPPTPPTNLTASVFQKTQAKLSWTASTDNIGVTRYTIYRNGATTPLASVSGTTTSYTDTSPPPGTDTYTVVAADAAGNLSSPSNAASVTIADTIAPTAPTNLVASAAGGHQINLTWNASTDNVGVTGYSVYRNNTKVADVSGSTTSYADTGVADATTYSYTVKAFDAAGNLSAASNTATATTPDVTPPTAPTQLRTTNVTSTRVDLSWRASTDNVTVTGYRVFRNGTQVGSDLGGSTLTYSDTTVVQGQTYSYTVKAFDAAGNVSAASNAVSVTIPTAADTTPPTAPTNLTATQVSGSQVNLAWSASTDNVGVAGYRVFRNGTQIGGDLGGSTLTYSDTTVVAGTTYSYTVKAFDAAGNISAASNTATITVDTTPPTAPGSPSATAVTDSLVKVTWTASTDNVGVTGYQIFRDGAQIGTVGGSTPQYSDSTVAPATSYTYTVKAVDAAGNVSAASAGATVTTPLFADGFETGDFSRWTTNSGLTAQRQTVLSGTWAAESASGPKGNAAYAYKQLASSQSNLYYEAHVRIISQKTNADLLRLRTGSGTSVVTLFFDGSRKLGYSNDVAGTSTTSTTVLNTGQWYDLRVHVSVATSLVEVWLDGTKISALSKTENLGSTAIGRVELGESVTGRNFDVAFDDVRVDPA